MKDFERKTHYKMYKSHRGWLVAGITVTSMALGIIAGPQATPSAHADDNAPVEETGQQNAASGSKQVKLQSSAPSVNTGDAGGSNPVSGAQPEKPASNVNDGAGADNPAKPAPEQPEQPEQPAGNVNNGAGNGSGTGSTGVNEKNSGPASVVAEDASLTSGQTGDGSGGAGDSNGLEKSNVAAPVEKPAVTTGITVQNPDDLTNKVAGQPKFNISNLDQLQYTYVHTDSAGNNTDLRVIDGYDSKHQVQGAATWLGETYANSIAQDAKGIDPVSSAKYGTNLMYIDEWLPDYALQTFLWLNNFNKEYASITDFRNNFTKAELATVTDFSSSYALQSVNGNEVQPTLYYSALMAIQTLEGLQNATNLKTLYLESDMMLNFNLIGSGTRNGNLWDIRALSNLQNLQRVDIEMASINDISALGNKPQLTSVNLQFNQVSDISPLATDKNLNISSGTVLGNQHILLQPIVVNTKLGAGNNVSTDGTLTYVTPSFIIKDLTSSNLPVKGFDNSKDELYPSLYPSSADAGNINDNTLSWYNLQVSNNGNYGSLSTTWSDPNSSFAGYIIQPYDLAENVSDLNVNIQLLQADGQQLTLAPSTLISGDVGSDVNVQENATVMSFLNQQIANGYTFSGLILDGTGLYSDYLAGNGKANAQPSWKTTLTDESKNWTVLFYKDVLPWNLSMSYGTKDDAGNFTPITAEDGTPVTDSYNGTSDTPLALNSYQKDFPDYVYTGAETSVDGQTWTDISSATDIPFVGAKQAVRLVYAQAKRATVTVKDATTGKTVQVLDYTTNPELRGAIGTTSTFDSATVIDPAVAKGYKLVSDTTKNADGSSAIVFGQADDTNLSFTITLAHDFKTTEKAVNETITYQDQQQKQVAAPVTKTMTFATVTDQVTQDAVTYSNSAATGMPALDVTGKPTDTGWVVYQAGDQLAFGNVKNPTVAGMHVVSTTDPANDLTQTTGQSVTPDSADLAITVTYAADATTGGGGDNGNNGGGNVTPPTTNPETPSTGGGADKIKPKKPAKKPTNKPAKQPAKVTTVGKKGTTSPKQPLTTATTGGQAAKVQELATPVSGKPAQTLAKQKTSTTLPQTNEQQNHGLAIVGLALLGALAGAFGWKKRTR